MAQHSTRFPVWGGAAVIAAGEASALGPAMAAVKDTISDFDLACSSFRADSELSRLNRSGGAPVRLSPLLAEALARALHAARLTEGAVDPTIGAALIAMGTRPELALDDQPGAGGRGGLATLRRVSFARAAGWRSIQFDPATRVARMPPGVRLDLGATGKALAADHAARRARAAAAAPGILVALAGDLACAGEPPPEGWRIRVSDDHRAGPAAPGQWIALRSGGLATSSTTVRRWATESGEAHHILDPASGAPVSGPWRTVSVAAATCLDANTASTAALVRGAEAPEWLEAQGLPSRLVSTSGAVLHLGGWPEQGDELR